jgi:hypothetical protein
MVKSKVALVFNHYTMQIYGDGGNLHTFLNSALDGSEWSASQ